MKKLYLISLLAILTIGNSNNLISQDINPLLYSNTWLDNETRNFAGYEITKIFGQLPDNPATYNYSPLTAVLYSDAQFLENKMKETAESEQWSKETIDKNLHEIKINSPGGQLQIYLTRYDEERANLKWYFVIIRGADDKDKIWEYDLPYQFPQSPTNSGWWNYKTIDIPIELPEKFYIYLNDKKSQYLSDFKFLVEKVETK
jgi:hypothetical protein